jgi:hypothetical protein
VPPFESPYRPEFEAALRAFARVSARMRAKGLGAPILVGGGAVELYSRSRMATGDLDICTPWQDEFEEALAEEGFVRPTGPGQSTRGWIHPELRLGVEVVSSTLLDGLADRHRVLLLDFGEDGVAAVISIEDIIADRMGQFASGSAPEMREQARQLLNLHPEVDRDYLERRIRQETLGEHGIATAEGGAGEV